MATNEKRKGRRRGCLITLMIIFVILAAGGGTGWWLLSKEHREAASLLLDAVDFAKLKDGTYRGEYAGGMYGWRANECVVTVTNGRVTGIQLVGSKDPGAKNTQQQALYDRVIKSQSLQVDAVSGATLTSKAYLKAVENALVQAERE